MAIKGAENYDSARTDEMNMLNDIDAIVKETVKNIEDGNYTPGVGDDNPPATPTLPTIFQTIEETKQIAENSVAKTVDYTPTANQEYNVEAIYSGYYYDQSWSTSDYDGTWSVWGTDDNYIYIISTTDTSKILYLQGALMYNNGATLLDTLCDVIFTNKTIYPDSAGQNLKLEQILEVKSSSVSNSAGSTYGTTPYAYNIKCPYIWDTYERSQSGSVNNRSKAYALTTNTKTERQECRPYYTLWHNDNINISSAWVNSNYYSLVMQPAQSRMYWLSSQYVFPYSDSSCFFGLQRVVSSGVRSLLEYDDSGSPISEWASAYIRPLVKFPIEDYALQENGCTVKIVKRG